MSHVLTLSHIWNNPKTTIVFHVKNRVGTCKAKSRPSKTRKPNENEAFPEKGSKWGEKVYVSPPCLAQ